MAEVGSYSKQEWLAVSRLEEGKEDLVSSQELPNPGPQVNSPQARWQRAGKQDEAAQDGVGSQELPNRAEVSGVIIHGKSRKPSKDGCMARKYSPCWWSGPASAAV